MEGYSIMEKSLYWAGDRGFRACTRWHDEEAINHLTHTYGWTVNYPFDDSIQVNEENYNKFFGKSGLLRHRCLTGIENSSIVIAYLGSYDTGTAQEIEYAVMHDKPIIGWSDSAIIVGEYAGRDLVATQDNIDDIQVKVLPMNGMTTVIDRYVEFSKLGTKTSPENLAEIINREAEILVNTGEPCPKIT